MQVNVLKRCNVTTCNPASSNSSWYCAYVRSGPFKKVAALMVTAFAISTKLDWVENGMRYECNLARSSSLPTAANGQTISFTAPVRKH